MRLKTLEIKGFKSFANHTVLHFNEAVTGVVGPNGSGKSNIVDAIRWVLGEQKGKELRLDNRSDVIFNGAEGKKPAGVAQVSITFENTKNLLPTEYNEVKLSRYLYRNGDSEYHLNGVKCRLRDIHDLLVDTGIGSNSYAIIALGMVEDILKDKDNARRKMFEQVAGISKFKKRKKETLNKLKSTSEDLERVEDLLHEIEGNMKTLEKQAKRAAKYQELKEEYKEKSITYTILSIADLKEKHKKYSTRIEESENKYGALEATIAKLEAELQAGKKDQVNEEQNLSGKQKVVNELVGEIREIENKKDLLAQQLEFKELEKNTNNSLLKESSPQLEELESLLEVKRNEQERLAKELTDLKAEFEQLDGEFKIKEQQYLQSKQLFDSTSSKVQTLEKSRYEKEKNLAILQNRMSVVENEVSNFQSLLKSRNTDFGELQKQKEANQQTLEGIKSKRRDKLEARDLLAQEKDLLKADIHKLDQKLQELNRTSDVKSNQFNLLKSMIENQEGFPESMKFLSKNWNSKVPVLADIVDVDKEYKGIIEHFLSPFLNYFIVDNVAEAGKAIDVLQKSQKGKAQFFLLDKIPATNKKESNLGVPAGSVLKVNSKYQRLLDHLLENVFITDKNISELTGDQIYLSKRGDFVKSLTSVSGGSVGLFEGKRIGRKKELEKLEKEIKELKVALKKIEDEKVKKDKKLGSFNIDQLNSEVDELAHQIIQLERIEVEFDTKIEGLGSITSELSDKVVSNEAMLLEISSQLNQNQKDLDFIKEALLHPDVAIGDTDALDKLAASTSTAAQRVNDKNIAIIHKKAELEKTENDISFSEQRKKELTGRVLQAKETLSKIDTEKESIQSNFSNCESRLVEFYEKKKEAEGELSEFEQKFFQGRNQIAEREDKIREENRRLQKTQILINESKDKLNGVKFQMASVGERVKIEFDIELDEVLKLEADDSLTVNELKAAVESIRRRLNGFGEINPMAVEAFNTMQERHELIAGQRNDILDAKESLLNTIYEIEETATDLFNDTFNKVRENFKKVFQSLFNEGDTCDLIIENEDNPLDSSIEIIARPKGKRPLSLSQLSGGEMTLTATALLFAFYLQKPAPFCIFDEVDAPLDDVNVLKFNNIIKEFSKDSQFVIVTHNKATMAEVDVLYGVYMQDMGISGVSPVDFRNFDHDPILSSV